MSEITDAVAALEEQAAEGRELRRTVERVETEIADHLDELRSIGSAILDLHFDLDNQIAEHDYSAVEQAVGTLGGLVDGAEILPKIDAVLLLTALLEGEPTPDLTVPIELFRAGETPTFEHPRLTQEDLDRQFQKEMADWSEPDEQDDRWAEDHWSAKQEAIRNRAHKAGLHLMELFDHIGDNLWPELIESVETGRRDDAVRALAAAAAAARDARPAYKLYEVNLSIQYEADPSSLGAMGEFLSGFETWLFSQKDS
ncbi:hypothetical protein ADK60_23230 [Streptomyces sp. XY431]|uniref:hypothetical protein n=1 Tax=Streptomyces sp. XY431 TaxID=1415562 RepID=UPI0006AFA240|nr:hypothetical protein [Streptomyces sp. XY431]KOV24897.1 hypothetical protein ADK60_23230 [Streptomyces sp. XY431]